MVGLGVLDMLKKKEKKDTKAIQPKELKKKDFGWSKVKVSDLHLLWYDKKSVEGWKEENEK